MRESKALRRLDRALMESIELHLRSDVPVGLFLSSGIDSATILAGLARHQVRVPAYTAGFDVPGIADERPEAAKLAEQAGAEHIAINIAESQTLRYLPRSPPAWMIPPPTTPSSPPGFSPAAPARM